MKNIIKYSLTLLILAMLWFTPKLQAQTVIWEENDVFRAENTGTEVEWRSGLIDISSVNYVEISMDINGEVNEGFLDYYSVLQYRSDEDYIECYYRLDGGPEVLLYKHDSSGFNEVVSETVLRQGLKGSTVEIIVRAKTTLQESRFWFIVWSGWGPSFNDFYSIDNIEVTEFQFPVLYAMNDGEWDYQGGGPDYNTIWSWDDYSGNQNSCDCFPDATTPVVIGNNHTVEIDQDGTTRGIRVENNGELIFTDNADLIIAGDGGVTVESNGRIDRNNETATLVFSDDDMVNDIIVTDGEIDIRDININGQNTILNISGNGDVNVNRNFTVAGSAGGSVINNNFSGAFTIGGNLQIEGSAIQFFNNRNLDISGNLRFNDDNSTVTNNSLLSVNNLTVNNNGDNGNVLTINAGATLNIQNNIDLNNGNFTINNSGTINQTGSFVNIDGGSNFYNLDGATWNFNGSNFDSSMSSVLSCDNGTNVFNYSRSGNQSIIIPVDAYSTLTVSGSGRKSAGGNLDINHDLNITGSARLDVNGHNINLAGDWNNSSSHSNSFVENNSSVTFDGNIQHIVNSSGEEIFDELEVNNNGLVLGSQVTIESSMTFTTGIVKTTQTTLLVIADDATANLNLNSYADGPVSKIGDDDFIFPIGKNNILGPVVIASINGSATTRFTAEYFNAPAPNGSNLPSSGLSHVSAIEYWDLKRVSSDNAEAIVGLGTVDKDRSQIYDETSEDAVIAHYNESSNEWEGLASEDFIVGGNVFSIVTQSAVSSFDTFTFGSSGGISPLPVTLVTFGGESTIGGNRLFWQTTSETENDYFAVERSKDGKTWETLGEVRGNGSISRGKDYFFLDSSPFYGSAFYRLKQVDFNGAFEYSEIISVRNAQVPESGIKLLYPNPAKDKVTIQYVSSGEGELSLSVVSQQGIQQIIKRYQLQGKHAEIRVDLSGLNSGLYFLVLRHNDTRLVKKIIKQ